MLARQSPESPSSTSSWSATVYPPAAGTTQSKDANGNNGSRDAVCPAAENALPPMAMYESCHVKPVGLITSSRSAIDVDLMLDGPGGLDAALWSALRTA